jgi:uncharacterized membrane protein YfcA
MFIILGYSLALIMGLILGLIGAGGSILTVPILVYLFQINPVTATSYSLLIVGSAASIAALQYWKKQQVNIQVALSFALPALSMMLFIRQLILPLIPHTLMFPKGYLISKDTLALLFFASLMITAGTIMLLPRKDKPIDPHKSRLKNNIHRILGSGCVGILTGFAGAGGGFLIIPALIRLFNLDIKTAIGTSLTIIAINTLIGFSADLMVLEWSFNWPLLSLFLSLTFIGMFLGTRLNEILDGYQVKIIFGLTTLLLGLFILTQEIPPILTQ